MDTSSDPDRGKRLAEVVTCPYSHGVVTSADNLGLLKSPDYAAVRGSMETGTSLLMGAHR
ncbi:unnamed protein product [Ranitomeya imitator]|uniref:Uncharacterized protein n=1 Tax=Ranitomeya imitator TaxID=111125 RepID=A0ABN9LN16_9NEOB|nr:unnamed protein product [Ranitomeya imitator]